VTGTFDDWGKTVQLEKKGDVFEKTVSLPTRDHVLYKVSTARHCGTGSMGARNGRSFVQAEP